jgi:chromate transport protein ChrA
MRTWTLAAAAASLLCLTSVAVAADPAGSVTVTAVFPTPERIAIIGLALTAVCALGARAVTRSPNTILYSVLAAVALTGVFVAYAHRVHSEFDAQVVEIQSHAAN